MPKFLLISLLKGGFIIFIHSLSGLHGTIGFRDFRGCVKSHGSVGCRFHGSVGSRFHGSVGCRFRGRVGCGFSSVGCGLGSVGCGFGSVGSSNFGSFFGSSFLGFLGLDCLVFSRRANRLEELVTGNTLAVGTVKSAHT